MQKTTDDSSADNREFTVLEYCFLNFRLCGLHIYINDSVEQKEVVPFKKIIEGAIGLAYHEETNQ